MAKYVVKLYEAKTVDGAGLMVRTETREVMVNDVVVVKTDIQCASAIIHVIDSEEAFQDSSGHLSTRLVLVRPSKSQN